MILEQYLLSDKGLRTAFAEEKIKFSVPVTDNQFQPASFDVRIGRVHVYGNDERLAMTKEIDARRMRKTFNPLAFDDSFLDSSFAKVYPDIKDIPIVFPPSAYAEVFFHEQVSFDKKNRYSMSHALRSSRGRLGIEPMTPYVHSDLPELPCMQYIRVINDSPNTWILRGQSSFTQLFFHPRMREDSDGHWENKYSKVRKLFPYFSAQKKILPDGRLVFTLGDSILRMNKLVAPIDTAMKMPENLYEQIDITCGYTLNPCEFVVASLLPAVNCPSHAGIRLLSRNLPGDCTRLIDAHQVNAQWVDPGYANSITCHPIRRGIPQLIRTGMPFVTGQVYTYDKGVERKYGVASLGSHYAGKEGGLVGSKS